MMDYLHFQDDNDEDEDGIQSVSSEDSLERRNEVEALLYSITHHNDLSHSLPVDLGERFGVNCSENGQVIVSLNEDLDENERDIVLNKINLIKSCDQSIDSDSDDREKQDEVTEEEKLERLGEHKENVENISNSVQKYSNINSDNSNLRNAEVLEAHGLSNLAKNNNRNSNVQHGYENRVESSCMLRYSDWKTNAKMEYISFKGSAKTKISKVPKDTSLRTQEMEITTDPSKNEMMVGQTQFQDGKLDVNKDYSIREIEECLRKEKLEYSLLVKNPVVSRIELNASFRRMKKLRKKLRNIKEAKTAARIDNERPNFTVKIGGENRKIICMDLSSASTSNECVVLDSDNEVVELEADLSGTKHSVETLDMHKVANSVCDNRDDIVCNFVNTSNKPCEEPDVINLESSGDERNGLNNENNNIHSKDKKLPLPDTPKKWTKSMIKFYCKTSKERRRFDCLKLIKDMRKTSSWADWVICKDDLIELKKKLPRCRRCREIGHLESKCKTPFRPIVCYMCGEPGHTTGRCPRAMCLFCGRKTTYYVEKCVNCVMRLSSRKKCKLCSEQHWAEVCPNLWRSYHLTTKEGPIVIPSEQKVNPRKYCWVCAEKGHFAHECNHPYYASSKELQTTSFITDYNVGNPVEEVREIILSHNAQMKLNSNDGECFLQSLCDRTKVRIDYITGEGLPVIKVHGSVKEWKVVRQEILKFAEESFMDQFMAANQQNNNETCVTGNKATKNILQNDAVQNCINKSTLYSDIYHNMNRSNKRKKKNKKIKNKKRRKEVL